MVSLRRCCRKFLYMYFFIFLVFLQGILIYFQIFSTPKISKTPIKSTCITKDEVRTQRKETPKKCKPHAAAQRKNLAFVFYITRSKPEYECYMYVNLHILQVKYQRLCEVDFVVLHEKGYRFKKTLQQFKRIQLFPVSKRPLKLRNQDDYFLDCFMKLEVFRLYKQYDRVVFTDVDGVFFKNPYPLLTDNLNPHQVGASFCNWYFPKKWLTSSIFVADLSKSLNDKFTFVLSKDLNDLYRNKESILDMEIFNWVLREGKDVKIYNNLFNMDSHYIDTDYSHFYNQSNVPYFVHFSHVKPHLYRRYSSCLDENREKDAKPEFFQVHRMFWQYYYQYC